MKTKFICLAPAGDLDANVIADFHHSSLPPVPTPMGSSPAAPPPTLEGFPSSGAANKRRSRCKRGMDVSDREMEDQQTSFVTTSSRALSEPAPPPPLPPKWFGYTGSAIPPSPPSTMKFPPEQQTRMGFCPSSLPPVPTLMGSYPAAPPPPLEGLSCAAGQRSRPTPRTRDVSEIVDSILISASSISPRSGILCDADTSDRRVASSVPARMEAGSLYGERREKKSAALELSVQEFAVPQGKPRKRRVNNYSVHKRDCSVTDRSWSGYADKESEEPGLFSALRMKPAVATVGREALKLKWTKIFQMQHQVRH